MKWVDFTFGDKEFWVDIVFPSAETKRPQNQQQTKEDIRSSGPNIHPHVRGAVCNDASPGVARRNCGAIVVVDKRPRAFVAIQLSGTSSAVTNALLGHAIVCSNKKTLVVKGPCSLRLTGEGPSPPEICSPVEFSCAFKIPFPVEFRPWAVDWVIIGSVK
jgi:hypothetical protein